MYMSDTKFELFLCGIMIFVGILIGLLIGSSSIPPTTGEYESCLKHAEVNYCKLHYKEAASYMEKNDFVFKVK